MNKDFQLFVAVLCNTVHSSLPSISGAISIPEVLKLPPVWWNVESNTGIFKGKSHATVQDMLGDIVSSIRENIVIRRVENITSSAGSSQSRSLLSSYIHGKVGFDVVPPQIQLGRSAAVVELKVTSTEEAVSDASILHCNDMARKLAMHIVAAKPQYLTVTEVPVDVIERETAIFRKQALDDLKTKPQMVDKIVAGKVKKRISEICLLEQSHVAEENSPVVEKFLTAFSASSAKLSHVGVNSYYLWSLGSSLQKENPSTSDTQS